MFSSIIPMQSLPLTIYDISNGQYKRPNIISYTPLDTIIIHKSVRKGTHILTAEKKIEVLTPPRVPTENEYFSLV